VAILVSAICGAMPCWSLAVVVALKTAIDNCRAMLKLPTEGMKALIGVDEKTAQLQLVFSLLLSVSLFVAAML
jgi:1,4-dihydroxy-2-naphthoate octaprenyltransferase